MDTDRQRDIEAKLERMYAKVGMDVSARPKLVGYDESGRAMYESRPAITLSNGTKAFWTKRVG